MIIGIIYLIKNNFLLNKNAENSIFSSNLILIKSKSVMIGPKNTTYFTAIFKTDFGGIKETLFIAYLKISDNIQVNVKFNDLAVLLTTKRSTSLKYGFNHHIYNKALISFYIKK